MQKSSSKRRFIVIRKISNNPNFHLKELDKEEKTKLKVAGGRK